MGQKRGIGLALINLGAVLLTSAPAKAGVDEVNVSHVVEVNSDTSYDTPLPSGETWRLIAELNKLQKKVDFKRRPTVDQALGTVLGRYVAELLAEMLAIEDAIANYGKPGFFSKYVVLDEMPEEMLSTELMLRSSRLGLAYVLIQENRERVPFEGAYMGWINEARRLFVEGFWIGLSAHSKDGPIPNKEKFLEALKKYAEGGKDCAFTLREKFIDPKSKN